MQYESDIISLWNVNQQYVFVETRLICNMLYPCQKGELVITRHNKLNDLLSCTLSVTAAHLVFAPKKL